MDNRVVPGKLGRDRNLPQFRIDHIALLAGALGWLRYQKSGSLSPFPTIEARLPKIKLDRDRAIWLLALLGVLVLAVTAIVISLGRGYSTYDGIANWAIKGYAIAEQGSIFAGEDWGNHGLAYPQNIHLGITLFRVMDGDILPGSKLIFPMLVLSLTIGCYVMWRRANVTRLGSSLATLALASLSLLFFHSTIGFANAPFTTYIVLGILYIAHGAQGEKRSALVLGSLLLGLAAWTRPEGVGYSALILLSLVVGSRLLWRRVFSLSSVAIPLITISAMWMAFGSRYVAEDEVGDLLGRFVPAVISGDIRMEPLSTVLRHATDEVLRFQSWGLMVIAIPGLMITGLSRSKRSRNRMAVLVGIAGLVTFVIPLAMFYIAGYSPGYSVGFLGDSFDRAMLPGAITVFWSAAALAMGQATVDRVGAY